MPQTRSRLLLLAPAALLLVLTACAEDVAARYPAAGDLPTGTLVIAFNQPVSNVRVSVNGELVGVGDLTERVTIERVPAGQAEVVVAGGDAMTAALQVNQTVEVTPGGERTLLLAAPEALDGAWVYLGLEYLGLCTMYGALLLAFF